MAQEEILRKLNIVLKEDINSEYQVVYIFSRIRKFLESRGLQSKYKNLNFYCNWALHSKIERTEPIADILRDFIAGKNKRHFTAFMPLHKSLNKFLDDYSLPKKILDVEPNFLRFINLLVDIYSDTPLEVYPEEKRIIIIKKPKKLPKGYVYGMDYEIK